MKIFRSILPNHKTGYNCKRFYIEFMDTKKEGELENGLSKISGMNCKHKFKSMCNHCYQLLYFKI